jgi:hypothetical protein
MPKIIILQPLNSATGVCEQELSAAQDVSECKTLVVSVQKPQVTTGTTTLALLTGFSNSKDAYTQMPDATFDLSSSQTETKVFVNPSRFVRWKIPAFGTGTSQFVISLVGRES